jgi:hypothetical protein
VHFVGFLTIVKMHGETNIKKINYVVPRYKIFSTLLAQHLSSVQIFS